MLILYVALKYDYGKLEQGYSFEHYNFYDTLVHMGHDVLYFDFMTLMQKHGQNWMNHRLLEVVKGEKPDLLFCILFKDELDRDTMRKILKNTDTITLNWFCDDHWRFDNFSRYWAPCFNWAVTTAQSALPKYARLGYCNVIKSQWACNHFLYRKLILPLEYDVTFVGHPHGNRRAIIQALRNTGINVRVWGSGWKLGRLLQQEMIHVFNQSRINLNLSNASRFISTPNARARNVTCRWLSRSLNIVPFGSQLKTRGKRWLSMMKFSVSTAKNLTHSNVSSHQYPDQIKARNFEVPGCGGFLLTGQAENLGDYYEIGKEIVCFKDMGDLIEKARYYLYHEDERAAIAQAGYQRTLHEHTYVHRFTEIFQRLGLPCESLHAVLEGNVRPGQTEEVR